MADRMLFIDVIVHCLMMRTCGGRKSYKVWHNLQYSTIWYWTFI